MINSLLMYLLWKVCLWVIILLSHSHSLLCDVLYVLFLDVCEHYAILTRYPIPYPHGVSLILLENSLKSSSAWSSVQWIKHQIIFVEVFEGCRWKVAPTYKALMLYSWKYSLHIFALIAQFWGIVEMGTFNKDSYSKLLTMWDMEDNTSRALKWEIWSTTCYLEKKKLRI